MQLPPQHLAEIVEALRRQERGKSGSEKRRFTRLAVVAAVKILDHSSGREFTALTRDISTGGLGLMQTVKLEKGGHFTVLLPRPRGEALTVRCCVTHAYEAADGVWGIGAQFLSFVTARPAPANERDAEALRIQRQMLS
jgi:PilZ domain